MDVSFGKYLMGNVTFLGAILQITGSIQYIRKITFIEIISLKKHLNLTIFVLRDTVSLKIVSGSIQYLIQRMSLSGSGKMNKSLHI